MLTLGKVGTRTDCKADNRRDQPVQRTARSCQLANKFVVWFFTLGPNCTSNMGYKTADSSLDIIIEISKSQTL
jgi:hypothetical protein